MGATVTITQERLLAATPDAVWRVVSTPQLHPDLDPRCSLESATGSGDPGSTYVLRVRSGPARTRLRYVVRTASAPTYWVADVDRAGRHAGVQAAELVPEGSGTLLRWTVTLPASLLTRAVVAAACRRELTKWLDAVDRVARADPPGGHPAG